MKTLKVLSIALASTLWILSCGSKTPENPAGTPDPSLPGQGFLSAGQPVTGVQPQGMQAADTSWIKVKHLDLAYASKSPAQKLDLYLPNEGSGPFPLIIEFHPGGFMVGGKSMGIGPMLEGLRRGYAVASVGYRLSGEAPFPAAVNDAKAAVKFLRASAVKYNLDPRRFAVWGSSAGGNLAALVAVSANEPSLVDSSLGNTEVSDAVQAAVDWYGPLDFLVMDEQFKDWGRAEAWARPPPRRPRNRNTWARPWAPRKPGPWPRSRTPEPAPPPMTRRCSSSTAPRTATSPSPSPGTSPPASRPRSERIR